MAFKQYMSLMIRFVGFWKGSGKWTAIPVANSATSSQDKIISKIKFVQKFAKETRYRGMSPCRICHCYNGCAEYAIDGFVWPSGYLHYIEDHNMAVDEDFASYINDFDEKVPHNINFDYYY